VTGEEREVDESDDVVHGVVVLGDPERPTDLRAVRARVRVSELLDRLGGDARLPLRVVERVLLHGGGVLGEAGGGVLDEGGVVEIVRDDLAPDRVRERDVGADVEPEPEVGPLGGGGPPRVDRVELRAVVDPLQDVVEEDGVRLARVRPPTG
jgi:hypothetical protein